MFVGRGWVTAKAIWILFLKVNLIVKLERNMPGDLFAFGRSKGVNLSQKLYVFEEENEFLLKIFLD